MHDQRSKGREGRQQENAQITQKYQFNYNNTHHILIGGATGLVKH